MSDTNMEMSPMPETQSQCGSPPPTEVATDEPCLGENPIILQIVFQYYVNNVNVLTKCRLVSKSWNMEACEKLRKVVTIPMYFSLQPNVHHNSLPRRFMQVMEKSFDCPFSMFSIICNEIESADVQEWFDNFGDVITSLKFRIDGGKNNNNPLVFKKLLTEQLPNLKELQLFGLPDIISKQESLFDYASSEVIRQLQSIAFWRTPGEDNECRMFPGSVLIFPNPESSRNRTFSITPLYWNILQHAASMTTFQANNLNCFFEMFVAQEPNPPAWVHPDHRMLMGRVKTFKMTFPGMETPPGQLLPYHVTPVQFPQISRFCNVFPNITSLDFKFEAISFCPTNQQIEMIIIGCAKILKKIRLQRCRYDSNIEEPRPPPLQFAVMTALKEIVVYHADFQLEPSNFPALKYLSVTYFSNLGLDGRYTAETSLFSVTTLKVGYEKLTHYPVKGLSMAQMEQIVTMFPCLRVLHYPATDDSLHLVYEKLPWLEELSIINSNIHSHSAFNAYPELTDEGITGLHTRTCAKIQQDKNYENVHPDTLRNRPYIGMLKRLQRFYTKGTLTNVSIRFGIADIKELTSLSFCHTQSPRKAPWCVCPSKASEHQPGRRLRDGFGRGNGLNGVGNGAGNRVGNGAGNRVGDGPEYGNYSSPPPSEIDQEPICLKPLADNCPALVKLEIKTCHTNSTDAVTQEDCDYIKARLPNLELIIDDRIDEFLDN